MTEKIPIIQGVNYLEKITSYLTNLNVFPFSNRKI